MRNHYVHKAYLSGFTSDASHALVCVFDKKQKCFFDARVGKVAREHGFYSDEDEKLLDRLRSWLAEMCDSVEGPALSQFVCFHGSAEVMAAANPEHYGIHPDFKDYWWGEIEKAAGGS